MKVYLVFELVYGEGQYLVSIWSEKGLARREQALLKERCPGFSYSVEEWGLDGMPVE